MLNLAMKCQEVQVLLDATTAHWRGVSRAIAKHGYSPDKVCRDGVRGLLRQAPEIHLDDGRILVLEYT